MFNVGKQESHDPRRQSSAVPDLTGAPVADGHVLDGGSVTQAHGDLVLCIVEDRRDEEVLVNSTDVGLRDPFSVDGHRVYPVHSIELGNCDRGLPIVEVDAQILRIFGAAGSQEDRDHCYGQPSLNAAFVP